MLVVTFGDIMFTGVEPFAQDGVHVVQARCLRSFLDEADLELYLRLLGDLDRFRRPEYAVFINRMNGLRHQRILLSQALNRGPNPILFLAAPLSCPPGLGLGGAAPPAAAAIVVLALDLLRLAEVVGVQA